MLSILKNRTFLLLFLGNTISLIGFGFNLVGVSWLVLEVTGSELALGKTSRIFYWHWYNGTKSWIILCGEKLP